MPSTDGTSSTESAEVRGITPRALIISLFLTLLAGLWVRQSEIVVLATQITESIPAIPGLAALLLLLPLNVALRRIPGVRPLQRGELLTIFLFVTISSTMVGVGVTQFLFALMGTPFYFSTGGIPQIRDQLPRWLMPHDPEIARQLYEGSPTGAVPWSAWLLPGVCWLGFFLALWITLYCLMGLFYRTWAEDERLAFPLVSLPIEIAGGEDGRSRFFRNPVMWSGFGLAAGYNLVNILHALVPSVPAFGKFFDLTPLVVNPPWNGITSLVFHIRPELIGLGFLVSTEISLTVWVAFLLEKLAAVAAVAAGEPPGRLPYEQEQGIGAYLTLAVLLCWLARSSLVRLWRTAWHPGVRGNVEDAAGARLLFMGLTVGFLAVWGFAVAAGMAAHVALVYLVLVLAVALVYGRLRAEAGVPLVWLFPYYMQKNILLYAFGSAPFQATGPRTMPTWALFTFLARGYYPAITGYQVEALELARRSRINLRHVVGAITLAVIVGFVIGWYNHLQPYYKYGAQQLRGEIWGSWIALPEYQAAARYASTPRPPDLPRLYGAGAGGLTVFLLWAFRLHFTGFWLHPLGYVMTCTYGSLIWSSFLLVWIVKSLTLRYGGIALYHKSMPFFLGLALGHFLTAGILWGLAGAWTGDAVQGYPVFFG